MVVFQTADAFRYAPMLAATAPTALELCRRNRLLYESFTGVKRGFFSWHACYNRIILFKELLDRGFSGWGVYLDADAYVHDFDFDVRGYLAGKRDHAAIFATSGVTGEGWDINTGVTMINVAHPLGRSLIDRWLELFRNIPDAWLRVTDRWEDGADDQALMHQILQHDRPIVDAVFVESMDLINSRYATFIRQHLRAQTADLNQRIQDISAEVRSIFVKHGCALPGTLAHPVEPRSSWSFLHPRGLIPELVAAPVPPPQPLLAAVSIAIWHAAAREAVPPHLKTLAGLLERGDRDAVGAELAALGSGTAGEGVLGGRRQHDRVRRDAVFAEARARRTYDALVSLGEMVGVLPIEHPEFGPWGRNAQHDPAMLFRSIADELDIDLAPPPTIGGYLGIAVGHGIILHLRMIEAIYVAWRSRELADSVSAARMIQLGADAGLTAHYARRFGLADIWLVGTPTENAMGSYVLADTVGPPVRLVPRQMLEEALSGSSALLVLEELRPVLWNNVSPEGCRAIFSLGAEVALADGSSDRAVAPAPPGFRRVDRRRHGIRPGFVEELFTATGAHSPA